jgi:hypothetical protein
VVLRAQAGKAGRFGQAPDAGARDAALAVVKRLGLIALSECTQVWLG